MNYTALIMEFSPQPVTSSLLGLNILYILLPTSLNISTLSFQLKITF